MPPIRHRIAAILPQELEYSDRLLRGAMEYVKNHRHLVLVDLPFRVDAPNALSISRPIAFDAALIWVIAGTLWVEDLLAAGVPLIGASSDWPSERLPHVTFDGKAVERQAVEHLAIRNPAMLVHLEFLTTGVVMNENRGRRFCEAARGLGIPARTWELFRPNDPNDNSVTRRATLGGRVGKRLKSFLMKLPRPAGIWCGEDGLALRVCEAAESLGLRIPEDIAVLGLGDFSGTETGVIPLSSIPLSGEKIGYRALSLLDRKLSGAGDLPANCLVTPPPVVARQSTVGTIGNDPVAIALGIIARRACEGITVRRVAEAVQLSVPTLNSRLRQRIGRTPGAEIRRTRLATAKRHLADARLTIGEVAHLCGYQQQSKFSNFFKREAGLSPRAFRQSVSQ